MHTIPKVVLQIDFHFKYKSTMYLYFVDFFQVQSTEQAKLVNIFQVQIRVQPFSRISVKVQVFWGDFWPFFDKNDHENFFEIRWKIFFSFEACFSTTFMTKNTYFFKPDRLDKFCNFNLDCGTNSGSFCCKKNEKFCTICTWLYLTDLLGTKEHTSTKVHVQVQVQPWYTYVHFITKGKF